MIKKIAYYIVFKDLTKKEGLFTGTFDAKNGQLNFMFGIGTVMECIAYAVSEKTGDKFCQLWQDSLAKSEYKTKWEK